MLLLAQRPAASVLRPPSSTGPPMPATARPLPSIVAVEGISGAGKSTIAERYARATGARWIPEAYERLHPRPSLEFVSASELLALERRLLREETRRFAEARRTVAGGRPAVADTGFAGPISYALGLARLGRTPSSVPRVLVASARALTRQGRWGVPDRIVWIDGRAATRRRRVARDPERHPARLADRHEAVGRVERALYLGPVARLYGPRFARVSGEGRPETVVRRVRQALATGPTGPIDPRVAREFLALLDPASPRPGGAGGAAGHGPRQA